jgi:hypothetical protein
MHAADEREMMSKVAAVLALWLAGSGLGCAARQSKAAPGSTPTTQPQRWRVDFSTSSLPKYLGSNGGIFHDAGVQQSSLTVSHRRTGAYGKVFMSLPLGDREAAPNYGRETDLMVGWNVRLRRLGLTGEANYIDVSPAGRHRGNAVQLAGTASTSIPLNDGLTLAPYSAVKFIFPTSGTFPDGGWFLHQGTNYGWSPGVGPSVGGFAEVVYDAGVFGFEKGFLSRAQTSLNWPLSSRWTLQAPVVQFSRPLSDLTDGRRTQVLLSAGVAAVW